MQSKVIKNLFAALLAVCAGAPYAAFAGAFTISPVRIALSARAPVVAVTVRNNDPEATSAVQAETMLWRQENGKDVYTESRGLIVSPPIFTLPPGGEQVVRIALRGKPDPATETLYRVYFQELPGAAQDAKTLERRPALKFVLRLGIPVVVAPLSSKTDSKAALRIEQTASGKQRLVIANGGNAHLRVTDLVLSDATTGAEISKVTSFYVLPGSWWASEEFPVANAGADAGVRVTASTDNGDLDTTLRPGPP